MRKLIVLFGCYFLLTNISLSQIEFELMHNAEQNKFTVSLSSDQEWTQAPYNRTASAQITLRAKSGTFQPSDIQSLIPEVVWALNSQYSSPEEAPGFDYFSFTMESTGTDKIQYLKDISLPIFEFSNIECGSSIEIVDNDSDPFKMPNSSNANIGNYISILGSNKLNSYEGKRGSIISQDCADDQNLKPAAAFNFVKDYFTMQPNLISTTGELVSTWNKTPLDAELNIRDVNGKKVTASRQIIAADGTRTMIDFSGLADGIYYIELSTDSWRLIVDKAIKIKE